MKGDWHRESYLRGLEVLTFACVRVCVCVCACATGAAEWSGEEEGHIELK